MRWLSSPKVRLALIVNGLYFISLFTPTPRHGRPRLFAHTRELRAESAAPAELSGYIPLAPPSTPSRASSYEYAGLIHVRLDKDLTLIRRPGRALQLSVNFHARTNPPDEPDYIGLALGLYSDDGTCPDGCLFSITTDGVTMWPTDFSRSGPSTQTPSLSPSSKQDRAPRSAEQLEYEQLAEMKYLDWMNATITYEQFLSILNAKRVIIRLGPDRVELTADQIEALRDMHRRLPQPPPPDDSDSD